MVTVGEAMGLAIFVKFNPVAGLQLYCTPPVPFSWVLPPGQMDTSGPALATIGAGFPMVAGADTFG